MCEET